jgi:hypothetical protein
MSGASIGSGVGYGLAGGFGSPIAISNAPGVGGFISSPVTPCSTTSFQSGVLNGAKGQPNGRSVAAIDPQGHAERIERVNGIDPAEMPQGEPIPADLDGSPLRLHNTFHWTKAALAAGGGKANAQITRWA